MKPLIRLAMPRDIRAINAIYNHYVACSTCTYQEKPTSAAQRKTWLAHHGKKYPVIVAERKGEVVGWASLSPFHRREAYRFTVENSVYIHPDHVGQGLGTALLAALLRHGRALGYRSVVAIISADQVASVALHARAGFRKAGQLRQVGFKFDRWLDVMYMQREFKKSERSGAQGSSPRG